MGGLPPEATSFVGRRHELAEARRQMYLGRLLTLTGPAGVGKSRLATRLARKVRRAFPGGVYRADLAALQDPALLPQAVASVFGVRAKAGDPVENLIDQIRGRRLLLILDDCDHVLEASARFVRSLLAVVSDIRVVVTSRQVLGVAGERVLPVSPLSVPRGGAAPVSAYGDVFADAVSLFVDRAVSVVPGFALTERNRDAVVRICRRLDGMPLAIELAVAQLRDRSLDELLHGLDDRFGLLVRGGAPSRNDALGESIGWSFELCTPDEQLLWERLACFVGDWDLAAAQEVCAGGELDPDCIAELVEVLVRKSVVVREQRADGRAYYRMFDSIREYGLARLGEAGERDVLAERHRDHFHRLADRYHREHFGPNQLEWIQHLIRVHANLRCVLEADLQDLGRARAALRMSYALWPYWFSGNALREGYLWLRRSVALVTKAVPERGDALAACAYVALHLGEEQVARTMLGEAEQLADDVGDSGLRARVSGVRGTAALVAGELDAAAGLLERAVAGHKENGDAYSYVNATVLLSYVQFFLNDQRGAEGAAESLRLCELYGATWTKCYALWVVALHRWRGGDHREATLLLQQAIRLQRSARDLTGLGFYLKVLSWCTTTSDHPQRTARLLGAADTLRRWSGGGVTDSIYLDDYSAAAVAWSRQALGAEEFESAYYEGGSWSREEMVAYALDEGASRGGLTQSHEPGQHEPGQHEPGQHEPGQHEPGQHEPGQHESGQQESGWREASGLTARELKTAALIAEGLTDGDVAARLGVPRQAAEGEVAGVLARLGFRDRAQIECWVRQHRDP